MVIKDPRVNFVMFTGSVANGHAVTKSASESFKGVGIELGGKDPAYVRSDANLATVLPALADAIFFNAGQSCCSVEVGSSLALFVIFLDSNSISGYTYTQTSMKR